MSDLSGSEDLNDEVTDGQGSEKYHSKDHEDERDDNTGQDGESKLMKTNTHRKKQRLVDSDGEYAASPEGESDHKEEVSHEEVDDSEDGESVDEDDDEDEDEYEDDEDEPPSRKVFTVKCCIVLLCFTISGYAS